MPGDKTWHCIGGRFNGNFTDADVCSADTCAATRTSVGWENENSSLLPESTQKQQSRSLSPRCMALAKQLCGDQRQNLSSCVHCVSANRTNRALLENNSCSWRLTTTAGVFCPRRANATVACISEAKRLCSKYAVPSLNRNCTKCLEHNSKDLLPVCGHAALHTLEGKESTVCPVPPHHSSTGCAWTDNSAACSNATWIGREPNSHKISRALGGSWFSTTSAGRCHNGARPGDGSGCSWRPLQLRKAVNYSCLQGNVAAAVMQHNPLVSQALPFLCVSTAFSTHVRSAFPCASTAFLR